MLVRTYVYRLKPTRAQHAAMKTMLDGQRQLYNAALQERIDAWRKEQRSITFNDQTKSLTQIRSFDEAYSNVPYNVSKWTLKRLDDAMKAFFVRVKRGQSPGFPRFRSMSRWNSIGLHQIGGVRLKNKRLLFSGGIVGALGLRMHRSLPEGAVLKSAVLTLEDGIWRVALSCSVPPVASAEHETAIGVDVGANWLATDSEGRHYANATPLKQRQKALRRAARAVSRAMRGSRQRRKTIARLKRLQAQIANHRRTHLHTTSKTIVASAGTIFVEDLKLKNMTRSARGTREEPGVNVRQKAGLNRVLQDAAPGRLIQMLTYKAESAGGQVIRVDPRNTSRTCSGCGIVDAAQAGKDRYRCKCGLDLQRDHNAAINIRARGLSAHEAARRLEELNVTDCGVRAPVNTELLAA